MPKSRNNNENKNEKPPKNPKTPKTPKIIKRFKTKNPKTPTSANPDYIKPAIVYIIYNYILFIDFIYNR